MFIHVNEQLQKCIIIPHIDHSVLSHTFDCSEKNESPISHDEIVNNTTDLSSDSVCSTSDDSSVSF